MANNFQAVLAPRFTTEQLAKALGVSTRTLNRWHDRRIGPARIKVGGKVLYTVSSVEKWLSDNEQAPLSQGGANDN